MFDYVKLDYEVNSYHESTVELTKMSIGTAHFERVQFSLSINGSPYNTKTVIVNEHFAIQRLFIWTLQIYANKTIICATL